MPPRSCATTSWRVSPGPSTRGSGAPYSALLENSGYETRPLDTYPTGIVDEMLDGADLLLLAPGWIGVYAKPFSAP